MSKIGIFAGSFDPFTNGHQDIVLRSLRFCDKLIIAIGHNPGKKSFFSLEERLSQIREIPCIRYELSSKVQVDSFEGLLVNYAKLSKANILIRGIRNSADFEYETNLANINRMIAPEIETVFLPTKPELQIVSSSATKELARLGVSIDKFVSESIIEAFELKKNKTA